MTNITIFGTGNMGSAIGGILSAGGHSVQHVDSSTRPEAITGEIVILAVPYAALASIAENYGAQFAGKVVVDITNPITYATFDGLDVPADSSAAAELAAALPQSRVLKAFNTNFASTLASGSVGSQPTTVLVAGDDAEAKSTLAAALRAGGVDVVDAGPLARAHELEAVGFLQMALAVSEQISWTDALGVIK